MAIIDKEIVVVTMADVEHTTGGMISNISGSVVNNEIDSVGGGVSTVSAPKQNQSSTSANEFIWS